MPRKPQPAAAPAGTQLHLATRDIHAPLRVAVLHITAIAPARNNPRRDLQDVDGLAGSLGQNGQLQNINVVEYERPDVEGRTHELVAGRRRYESIRLLFENGTGTGQVHAAIHPPGTDPATIVAIATIENEHRRALRPGERIAAIAACVNATRMTLQAIAENYGTSVPTIRGDLRLAASLPPIALEKLDAGQLTKEAATRLVPLAKRAPAVVEGVIRDLGERVGASQVAANPDLVVYEAVRDGRVQDVTYAEVFSGGLDVLAVDDVINRAVEALKTRRQWRERTALARDVRAALELISQLAPDERLAHVEPSDVHQAMQTAPDGAIVALDTRGDRDGDLLARAVICTSPTLMLEWAVRATNALAARYGNKAATPENLPPTILDIEQDVISDIKADAKRWNRAVGRFCDAITSGTDGCDLPDSLDAILLGICHARIRLLVGQGLGHVRADWRVEAVEGTGGFMDERDRPPLGAEEAQRRFDAEIAQRSTIDAKRMTVSAVVAGALCDTREVGARERHRRLQIPTHNATLTGGIGTAILALAHAWDHAPEDFAATVVERLDLPAGENLALVSHNPSSLKRRARAA
ncbi:ParB/RepB/Spo0J family partition protein [Conexibacter sp. JD483]|uniref:ParB/RepB/Spo0J family partition protein n=1 Tax=unclassified Conexibacter TaxID=2627773 RepID=UPI00271C81C4|nr:MULTISPECIES: ParB/RepB/Spo0J family partition protein [unclassified Conexibacter]MDO8185819.1 ParB/RepB/Spo0J family partition protein [Conexibacter sp. CPCC 205706]MDO8198563.1 ParB/RepB/Spo0J family partition protein [Conexibacter sp. CPCC 205762]MDR9367649.1 ParB/RepB/Spo0J family partition protein [Conexibacter sp. JD483]